MTTEATRGPWTWNVEDASMLTLNGPDDAAILACYRCKACEHDASSICFWPNEANSALIASAPALRDENAALVEALEGLERALDRLHLEVELIPGGGVKIDGLGTLADARTEARRALAMAKDRGGA